MAQPPFPCPTKLWYNDTYPEINPKKPELSASGKRIVVTGGGTGIGRAIAKGFATAGADSIVLLGGRREELLQQTKSIIGDEFPEVKVEPLAVDIADAAAVGNAAKAVGQWDVLVLNAAYMPAPTPVLQADLEDQAKGWTVNIQGNFHVVHYLLPARKTNAVVLAVSTGAVSFPANLLAGNALYMSAKLALSKFMEVMSAEVTDARWITFHPGVRKLEHCGSRAWTQTLIGGSGY